MIRLICKECGAAQQIKLTHKNVMFLRVAHVMCPHCQHVFDWEHTEIIVRVRNEKRQMNLHKLKVWINENSIEIQSGIKVISVTQILKRIEEMEEGKK